MVGSFGPFDWFTTYLVHYRAPISPSRKAAFDLGHTYNMELALDPFFSVVGGVNEQRGRLRFTGK